MGLDESISIKWSVDGIWRVMELDEYNFKDESSKENIYNIIELGKKYEEINQDIKKGDF